MSKTRIGFCLFKSTAISVEKIQRRYLLITSSLTLHCSYTFSVFLSKYGITFEERTESEGICSYILPRHQLSLNIISKRETTFSLVQAILCAVVLAWVVAFRLIQISFSGLPLKMYHTHLLLLQLSILSLSSVHLLLKDSFFKRSLQSDCACDVQHKWETQLNPNPLTVGHS